MGRVYGIIGRVLSGREGGESTAGLGAGGKGEKENRGKKEE